MLACLFLYVLYRPFRETAAANSGTYKHKPDSDGRSQLTGEFSPSCRQVRQIIVLKSQGGTQCLKFAAQLLGARCFERSWLQ
jgi:hypothetical protein